MKLTTRSPAPHTPPTAKNRPQDCSPSSAPSPSSPTAAPEAAQVSQEGAVFELQQDVQCLETVVARLEQEKHALKMRLNEIEFLKKFNVGDCRKWLSDNYDFDRKDSAALLAQIFENYLMQNEQQMQPLPHQLMVKNPYRKRARRTKAMIMQSLTVRRESYRRERIPGEPCYSAPGRSFLTVH